ncbi:hypothetical protein [Myceligenerans indicum]|uniref:Uncharacterized protein n=1 Tax=Myceligenerans indicum TaxID=2593663 RepID=A0ABS1LP07_9MICO|nr:hypothetical protein [Myceligenerans indicum]MBL0887952.1 hypothetical protein [Myceligenerans indicum]
MPREITILAPRPLTDAEILHAATGVLPDIGVRRINPGALLQFAAPTDDGVQIVLTLEQPALLRAPKEVERLHPDVVLPHTLREAIARAADDPATAECVWIEATAPATPFGLVGIQICRTLADLTDGTCIIQDGR